VHFIRLTTEEALLEDPEVIEGRVELDVIVEPDGEKRS
jgi:hypothetical protein